MLRSILAAFAFTLVLVAQGMAAVAMDLPRGELRVGFSNTRVESPSDVIFSAPNDELL